MVLISNIAPHYREAIYKLIDKEFDCDFVFGDNVDNIKKIDYSVFQHKVKEVHNSYFKFGYFQKGVLSLLGKNFDKYIVIGDTRCVSTWMLVIGSKFYSKKEVYFWSHGLTGKESWIKRIVNMFFFRLGDGSFLYNERARDLMIQLGLPHNKVYTIYNSLNYDEQLKLRISLKHSKIYHDHFCNDNRNIIFIGRLTPVKKFDLLIDAIALSKKHGKEYNVTFIGDGTEREKMERRVDKLEINNQVWFYGACYDEGKNAELIFNADLCVSPGNIGLTAMHVMMFGCPAITNDDFKHQMPEFEAIVDNKTGSFFKHDDSDSLSLAIENWFASHDNDREQVRMDCYNVIDTKWNPHNQISILKRVLRPE